MDLQSIAPSCPLKVRTSLEGKNKTKQKHTTQPSAAKARELSQHSCGHVEISEHWFSAQLALSPQGSLRARAFVLITPVSISRWELQTMPLGPTPRLRGLIHRDGYDMEITVLGILDTRAPSSLSSPGSASVLGHFVSPLQHLLLPL